MNATPSHAALPRPPAVALQRVRPAALWIAWLCVCAGLLPMAAAAATPTPSTALPAVVVWDFDNQTPKALARGAAVDFLRRSLSENLTATLMQVAGLPVVERQRLKDLLAEQRVSAGELADEDARVRLGRIVGAARMVFGGFFVIGDEVQVHVRVIDTATSRVLFSDEIASPLPLVMQQVEPLNRRLARALGGTATGGRSFAAESWRAYDEALALADAGRLDEAVDALQRLLIKDKDFTPAERQLVSLLDKMARR
jgi:TolB-like protein